MLVETTHLANLGNFTFGGRLDSPESRSIFAERQVSSPWMVIIAIGRERAMKRALAEDDDMIQTFAANGPNQTFGVSSLPWRSWRG